MIIWITMQVFEKLFATTFSGYALLMAQTFGFIELLVETGLVIYAVVSFASFVMRKLS